MIFKSLRVVVPKFSMRVFLSSQMSSNSLGCLLFNGPSVKFMHKTSFNCSIFFTGINVTESSKGASSTSHVFEVEALNLYRLSISFEVEEDNDFDGLEEDEELMRQLEEEMVETMSGEAGGLVSAEINLKVFRYQLLEGLCLSLFVITMSP